MINAATSWASDNRDCSAEHALLALLDRVVALEGGGEGEDGDLTHQAAEQVEEARAAAKRHGAQRVAVIAAVEGDEYAPPRLAAIGPILVGDLQRHLHRGRAVVGEEDASEIARQETGQRRCQIDRRPMGEACEHHMGECGRLPGERLVQLGMGMPVGAGPPGRDEVEDLAAIGVEQRGALGARDDEGVCRGLVLGEGMPDMTPVASKQIRHGALAVAGVVCVPVVHDLACAS